MAQIARKGFSEEVALQPISRERKGAGHHGKNLERKVIFWAEETGCAKTLGQDRTYRCMNSKDRVGEGERGRRSGREGAGRSCRALWAARRTSVFAFRELRALEGYGQRRHGA